MKYQCSECDVECDVECGEVDEYLMIDGETEILCEACAKAFADFIQNPT